MDIKDIYNRVQSSDIGRRMATGAFWSFAGTAIAKALVLISSIICAHILSKQQYGELGMVRSTVNMFVVFGSAGLGMTATKYIAEFRDNQKERIPSIYMLTNVFATFTGIIVSLAILVFAPYLANTFLETPSLLLPLRLGALMLFVTVLNGAQIGTLSGLEDFKSIAINNLFGSIAEAVFLLIGAYYFGVVGAVIGYGTGFIVLYISNRIAIDRKFNNLDIKVHFRDIKKSDLTLLYKFSIPAALSSIMVAPTYWVVKAILTRSSGMEEVAMYEAADQWKTIILFIPTAISQIALPILANTIASNENKFWKVLKANLMLNGGVSFLIALIVSLLSPFILRMYGSDYNNAWVLVLLAISTIFSSLSNVVGLSISSRSKMWTGFGFNVFWAILLIGFTYLFLKWNMGATGLALALVCSYAVHTIIQFIYLRIITKQKIV